MTTEELFDAVAPIAIYHLADCLFKRRAQVGLRKLKAAAYVDSDTKLDDLCAWAKSRYDETLVDIVLDLRSDWTWTHDRWGAKTYYDSRKRVVFSGGENGNFPWFETAELLKESVNEHEEHAEQV